VSINKQEKGMLKEEFGRHLHDTGSPEIQIAILTKRIENLTEHFKKNKKDHGSKKGLYEMVSRRKKLINYLKKKDPKSYQNLIEKLGIRR